MDEFTQSQEKKLTEFRRFLLALVLVCLTRKDQQYWALQKKFIKKNEFPRSETITS